MDIDIAALLEASDVMLLFAALGMGLLIGKLKIGSFQLGSTPGVLIAAILLGAWGFDMHAQTESMGFMLFIFCVGIEAGPNFFSNFLSFIKPLKNFEQSWQIFTNTKITINHVFDHGMIHVLRSKLFFQIL